MSGPALNSLPSFDPDLPTLASLSTTIQETLKQYESSSNPSEKASLLQKIQLSSTKLTRLTSPIPQQFMELNFRPNLNVAIRIALEMNLLDFLPLDGKAISMRIARVLGAYDILTETYQGDGVGVAEAEVHYSHTAFSRFLTSPAAKASTKHLFDNMFQAQTLSAGGGYYKKHGFHSPTSSKNCGFSYAHGKSDMSIFDILKEQPERMSLFNEAMMVTASFGLSELVSCYEWEGLRGNEEGVVLVDVGGGKGHIVRELRGGVEGYKGRGKLVLQDLGVVLNGGVVDLDDEVVLMPYNFFEEIQPVKGANYFFKGIFHDWPDAACLQILKNLAPAMKPTSSNPAPKLLITDLVLADHSPPAGFVLRDMNMLCIGGKERSLSQWKSLMSQGGYKIVNVYGSPAMTVGSVVECVLA